MDKKEWEKLKHINKEAIEINKEMKAVTKQYRENLREYKKADSNRRAVLQQEFNELSKQSSNLAQKLLDNMKRVEENKDNQTGN